MSARAVEFVDSTGTEYRVAVNRKGEVAYWVVGRRQFADRYGPWWSQQVDGIVFDDNGVVQVVVSEVLVPVGLSSAEETREAHANAVAYLKARYGLPFFVALQSALT